MNKAKVLNDIKTAPAVHVLTLIFSYLLIGPLWMMIAYAIVYVVFPDTFQMWGLAPTIGWKDGLLLNIARAFLMNDIFGLRLYNMLQNTRRLRWLVDH